jgi:hypothetical protein
MRRPRRLKNLVFGGQLSHGCRIEVFIDPLDFSIHGEPTHDAGENTHGMILRIETDDCLLLNATICEYVTPYYLDSANRHEVGHGLHPAKKGFRGKFNAVGIVPNDRISGEASSGHCRITHMEGLIEYIHDASH